MAAHSVAILINRLYFMIEKIQACRISQKGNILFPDELIIDTRAECVTYRKFRIIGCDSTRVKFDSIASVSMRKNILFADIIIETRGGGRIIAEGFSFFDAERIVSYF